MGPINYDWVKTHGEHWAGGRIDIRGNTASEYGDEIALPIMHSDDWQQFSIWLEAYSSKEPQTLDEILKAYYNEGNVAIRWFKNNA